MAFHHINDSELYVFAHYRKNKDERFASRLFVQIMNDAIGYEPTISEFIEEVLWWYFNSWGVAE